MFRRLQIALALVAFSLSARAQNIPAELLSYPQAIFHKDRKSTRLNSSHT